mmetsp:Transcript_31981/g.89808  ORF Transcript_31981/g.89808 Transcript_31981/m.89808 type:complete len:283 (+) Transcript_31981:1204-2052(+)
MARAPVQGCGLRGSRDRGARLDVACALEGCCLAIVGQLTLGQKVECRWGDPRRRCFEGLLEESLPASTLGQRLVQEQHVHVRYAVLCDAHADRRPSRRRCFATASAGQHSVGEDVFDISREFVQRLVVHSLGRDGCYRHGEALPAGHGPMPKRRDVCHRGGQLLSAAHRADTERGRCHERVAIDLQGVAGHRDRVLVKEWRRRDLHRMATAVRVDGPIDTQVRLGHFEEFGAYAAGATVQGWFAYVAFSSISHHRRGSGDNNQATPGYRRPCRALLGEGPVQ